jgi:uncharacterized protein
MLLALLVLVAAPAAYPAFNDYVVDAAHVLDAPSVSHLKQVSSQLDHAGIAQVAVATVTQAMLGDTSRQEYASELFKRWGLGHGTKRDDGLLVLFVPGPAGHRGFQIETGYGLEGVLPDGKIGQIRNEQAFPYMRNDDYSSAAVHTVDAVAAVLNGDAAAGGDTAPGANSPRRGTGQGMSRTGAPEALGGLFVTLICMFGLVLALATSGARRRFPGRKTQLTAAGLTGASVVSLFAAGSGAGWIVLVLGLILTAVIWASIQSHRCPRDGSWMTIEQEVIDEPTYWSDGIAHVWHRCTKASCGYQHEYNKRLPRKQPVIVGGGGGGGFFGGGGGGGGGFGGGGGGRSGGGGGGGDV